jgi:hypothetical protein
VEAIATSCSDEPAPPPPPEALFAADWASAYQEVRDCRRSGDHDLNYVRVLADEAARDTYLMRDEPFAVGAVILKPEYADEACTDLAGFTVMRRESPGYDPAGGDWHWQRADAARVVKDDGVIARCVSCHQGCGVPPDGHDGTCALP